MGGFLDAWCVASQTLLLTAELYVLLALFKLLAEEDADTELKQNTPVASAVFVLLVQMLRRPASEST